MLDNKLPKLTYSGKSKSVVPIVSESELQTVTAEPWLKFQMKDFNLKDLFLIENITYFYVKYLVERFSKLIYQAKIFL